MRRVVLSFILLVVTALILSACGGSPAAAPVQENAPAAVATTAPEMQHDADPMSDNSYDVHFIDSTLEHHAGVLTMAQQALAESSTVALKDLAQQTLINTQAEIDWLKNYRQANHPNAAAMKDEMEMGAMGISTDASKSFDLRYAEAMINHHQGSIDMAKEAQSKVGHAELRQFAGAMQSAEEAEVALLQQYLK